MCSKPDELVRSCETSPSYALGLAASKAPPGHRSAPPASCCAIVLQPIVAGVPSMGQALAGMNAYDVSRMVVWGSAAAAAGFMFGESLMSSKV